MANKMLIDTTHPEETRVVVLRGNRVEEFDLESASRRQLRGNIYLAKVTRVEPSLQAAFVEYGGNRHGFLAFSEIHPDYYQIPVADRQALIDEDERAHRDADDEADRRAGGRSHGRGRGRSANTRQPIQRSEPVDDHSSSRGGSSDTDEHAADDASMPAAAANEANDNKPSLRAETSSHSEGSESRTPDDGRDLTAGTPQTNDFGDVASAPASHPQTSEPQASAPEAEDRLISDAAQAGWEASAASQAQDNGEGQSDSDQNSGNGSEVEEVDGDEDDVVESVGGADALEEVQERMPRFRRQYKIQEVIKRRQVMLVQVVKEERGTKGAALTTYLSLAGRYAVLMPNTARGGGISRKITSAIDRKRLKQIATDMEVPEGMGVILRTAGANRTKAEVKRDFEYLLRLWETVRDLTLKSTAPKLVYEEGSLIKRTIRDLYNKDIDEVVVAGEDGYREAKDFMRMLMPSHAKNVKLFRDSQPILTRYGIESQLDAMFSPVVQLRSGGYIVINQAEALVAIDVNSGRATREHHIEDTALKTNLEAAEEVSRQLRLRDLAGLIVIDFIDMDEKRNNRAVERRLKECLKNDRARIQVGRVSHFGLLEMSRQRIRSSVLESSTEKCPHCGGTGHVRSVASVTLQLLRSLEETLLKGATHNLIVRTRSDIALYVLNHKRAHLRDLETRFRITVTISADATINAQQPFVIERGEQVHTVEAARAIAVQPDNTIAVTEAEEEEDTVVEEDAEDAEEGTAASEGPREDEDRSEADAKDDESRRRRRRRRRRGPGEPPDHPEPGRHVQSAPDEVQETARHDARTDEERTSPETASGGNGEAERRRRRRGRRGGRRSRRDNESETRTSPPPTNDATEGWQEWAHGPQADAVEPPAFPGGDVQPHAPAEIAPVTANQQPAYATPAPEPVSSGAARRRSTVREPAPFIVTGEGASAVTNSHADAAPAALPTSEMAPPMPASADDERQGQDADRPRKTGWWSRRVFGGKG